MQSGYISAWRCSTSPHLARVRTTSGDLLNATGDNTHALNTFYLT